MLVKIVPIKYPHPAGEVSHSDGCQCTPSSGTLVIHLNLALTTKQKDAGNSTKIKLIKVLNCL